MKANSFMHMQPVLQQSSRFASGLLSPPGQIPTPQRLVFDSPHASEIP